jgi:hypothetical protein
MAAALFQRPRSRVEMKKASEYRQHAQECRELAAKMASGEQREQLLRMAAHWEKLADDRSALIAKHPELDPDAGAAAPERPRGERRRQT